MKVSLTMTKRFIAREEIKKFRKYINEIGTPIDARKCGGI